MIIDVFDHRDTSLLFQTLLIYWTGQNVSITFSILNLGQTGCGFDNKKDGAVGRVDTFLSKEGNKGGCSR